MNAQYWERASIAFRLLRSPTLEQLAAVNKAPRVTTLASAQVIAQNLALGTSVRLAFAAKVTSYARLWLCLRGTRTVK